ncbi:sugar phosphate isomerase/epimerase family protein [Actibacterium ureilyticum]|uniref:sugar phosphate isomerase/epimerase family protein n=1 Tax=Actibacterium ureilyticum TaxID=1590614 RepID=UPI000BAAA0AE|nr:TIM barrel protein [Actibacterium ureilyticum]
MGYRYSLAFLTVSELPPPRAVEVAARAGFDCVGLRLLPSGTDGPYPILTDRALQRATLAALRDTGVTLADIEIIRITPDFDVEGTLAFLETGARLGATNILTAGYDPDENRMIDNYGAFCELAQGHGMTADLEFMPWTNVATVGDAARIVAAVNHSAAGVLVDALHVQRSDSPFADIAALQDEWIHYAQLCDAPGVFDQRYDALIATARENRQMPGDGDFDFDALLTALPDDIVLSVEVPQLHRNPVVPASKRAAEALTKAKRVGSSRSDLHASGPRVGHIVDE